MNWAASTTPRGSHDVGASSDISGSFSNDVVLESDLSAYFQDSD